MSKKTEDLLLTTLIEKSQMKRQVYLNTKKVYKDLRIVLENKSEELKAKTINAKPPIKIAYLSNKARQANLTFAGDTLIFHMHTNVFQFDKNHFLWKTSYLEEDPLRSYCGIINIYNFLTDSLRFNRINDSGYLVGRIFINKDLHFFVEGKRQLGYLYNDFVNEKIDKVILNNILESAMLYTLDFDLLTPPYSQVKEVTVDEIKELSRNMPIRTAKRLGFRFESDSDVAE